MFVTHVLNSFVISHIIYSNQNSFLKVCTKLMAKEMTQFVKYPLCKKERPCLTC